MDREKFIRPIAHRGLHAATRGLIENTAPAFQAAMDKGYGIECDLQAASDGVPVVFHDATLDRLVKASGPVAARTSAELAELRHKKSDEPILTFADLLRQVAGHVPILVEVKAASIPLHPGYLPGIASQATAYRGPLALMSFNPDIVSDLSRLAPAVPCGLVAGDEQIAGWRTMPESERIAAVDGFLGKSLGYVSFFAVAWKMLPETAAWMAQRPHRLPVLSWTIRTPEQRQIAERWADAPIFENYEP